MATAIPGHGDRKGRHYYTTIFACLTCIVVATLAVAMHYVAVAMPWLLAIDTSYDL